MQAKRLQIVVTLATLLCVGGAIHVYSAESPTTRQSAERLMNDGNFNEAYEAFRRLALSPDADPKAVGDYLRRGIECLGRLSRTDEIDAFREAIIDVHKANWRLLAAAAQSYMEVEHYGFMIAGEFSRGQHRGGGKVVNANDRDRVRALQLFRQSVELAGQDQNLDDAAKREISQVYMNTASALLYGHGYLEAWRLQYLTDLEKLPDYEDGWGHGWGGQAQGAPVDEEGNPIFYAAPRGWNEAANDGQRWRWCLAQAAEYDAQKQNYVRFEFAQFLESQFGVQTMAQFDWFFRGQQGDNAEKDESGTYALHTLADNETIARLATGIKRFPLPDEFNHIKVFEQIVAADPAGDRLGGESQDRLANIYSNRRQYPKAADAWRKAIERYGPGPNGYRPSQLEQIVGNWGRFESIMTQPAGQGATVELRFRNGEAVEFSAREINVKKLLDDMKAYLKSRPAQLDWNKLQIDNVGYQLVYENQSQYLGREVATWRLDLDPREAHFDKRITVNTPLQKAGAYFVTAKMADGNTTHIVLWVADTAIVKKPMPDKSLYYVADAGDGKPVAKANVEFFGFWQEHVDGRSFRVHVEQFAELTDANGLAYLPVTEERQNYQWIATASTESGRLAHLGFSGVWRAQYYDAEYEATKVFTITDRPVYRPGQKVQFKFWVRHAKYDLEDASQFAGQSFVVEIHNPKGERVLRQEFKADEYGGIAGEFPLPEDATLGQYSLQVANQGGGSFRVEEYKKPEFEVTVDSPEDPIMLGEKATATIHAKYYFGAPVVKAKVKYKVLRTAHAEVWFPPHPWDWLYGPGYWWFAYDYDWYPGWARWGCMRPAPWWIWRQPTPPEIVAEAEQEIGADGTVTVEIDTALAKEIHANQDHRYEIQVEVTDESRRTIVGSGQVLVAREPFKVTVWLDRGYYRVGDDVRAHFAARTIDSKPVQGNGKARLFRIRYENAEPVEVLEQEWNVATGEEGLADLQFDAGRSGQFRLSYELTDQANHTVEGAFVFTIIGEGFDGSDFRFDEIEVIPQEKEFQPGDTARLQVNTNRTGAAVLFFVRPANGAYLAPTVLRMDGKSTITDVEITKKDMPNFFVEAVTVHGGQVHSTVRELFVPPEKRVLGVEVLPSAEEYKPGEAAKVEVKLTDHEGKPYVGSTVLAIYDKSVEYISGGSNVADIKKFFWEWRRHHQSQQESNLLRYFGNLDPKDKPGMQDLGIFGASVPEEVDQLGAFGGRDRRASALGASRRELEMAVPAAPMTAMAEGAMADDAATLYKADGLGQAVQLVEPTVRTEFADTALWVAAIETNSDGLADVELEMPENLTTWKVRVWGMGHGTRVGEGSAEVITTKNLLVRLQAPRFFTETDEVVLSANVHNYLESAKTAKVRLEVEGGTLSLLADNAEQVVEVPADGEVRVDWRVKAVAEGTATVRMLALTDEESDAMQLSFPVQVHGMLKQEAWSGVVRTGEASDTFTVNVPSQRRPEQTRLEVRYSPTLAGAMVDALPYLIDYPYGCTEQTLNRFLPAVITQRTLQRMGLDLAAIKEKQINLNAQELGDAAERAAQWQRYDANPVFDVEETAKIVKAGVARLTEMQLADGGWGWFSGWGEQSTPHTTAVVVHGLTIALKNDVALVPGVLDRGVAWLKDYQDDQVRHLANVDDAGNPVDKTRPYKRQTDNIDALVYMVLVDAAVTNDAMRDYLYRDRTKLAVYAMATYGVALHKQNEAEKLAMIMRNISQYLVQDDENQTAWLRIDAPYWYWYGSEIEAHAYYLKLLAAVDPQNPVASRLVKYMLNNRKHATYWNSTRDTALVVEAFADYLQATGEAKPDMTVEVWVDGQKHKDVRITTENLFSFDNKLVLAGDAMQSGPHKVELRRVGDGPLYFNGYLTNFTLEDFIEKAGLEVKVERKYFKLTPVEKSIKVAGSRGQAVDQRVEDFEREELPNWAPLKSGDLVEVELVVESKNDYEYIVIEDMKAAGCEPVAIRSGYGGNEMGAYMELRDNRVVLFVGRLMRGRHSVSYRLRAEIPGAYSALPTTIEAMYTPELKGNSDEIKLRIE